MLNASFSAQAVKNLAFSTPNFSFRHGLNMTSKRTITKAMCI